jgi:hypothetical protein
MIQINCEIFVRNAHRAEKKGFKYYRRDIELEKGERNRGT